MDIDHMKQHRNSKTNNKDESIAFSQSIGARMSAMEHLVPEQMFSTETEKAQGISAVKALAVASQQGQKIWTINQSNVNLALSRINLGAEAENDIRNAVYAGKIATAHEIRINFNGWIGEGYILMDQNTGAGAYMISGGGNGSDLASGVSEFIGYVSVLVEIADKLTGEDTPQKQTFKFILKAVAGLFSWVSTILGMVADIAKIMAKCSSVDDRLLMYFFSLVAVFCVFALGALLSGVGLLLMIFGNILISFLSSFLGAAIDSLISTTCKD